MISVTESIVARAQGNYAPVAAIAEDVERKAGRRNGWRDIPHSFQKPFCHLPARYSHGGAKKVVLMLSYPSDEVGNELVSLDQLDEAGVNHLQ